MEYVYATLLLHAAKKEISEDNLKRVLEAVGIEVDEVRLKSLVAAIKEINIDEVLKSATAMPVAPAVATAGTQEATKPAETKEEEEKKEEEEEKKEALSEEELSSGLSALFG